MIFAGIRVTINEHNYIVFQISCTSTLSSSFISFQDVHVDETDLECANIPAIREGVVSEFMKVNCSVFKK